VGLRLDQFLKLHFESFSREKIKQFIFAGNIGLSPYQGKLRPSTKLLLKQKVTIDIHNTDHELEFWRGCPLSLEQSIPIVFEDDQIIVISKPPFMATHPTGKHLFNCATVLLEEKLSTPVYSIHRLDRETSGVLVLGKTKQAPLKYTPMFEEKKVEKAYFFIAHNKTAHLDDHIIANQRLYQNDQSLPRHMVLCAPEASTIGKSALTEFEIVNRGQHYIIGLAFPKTGRQHQIRAHAAHHGMPLLGDKMYTEDPKLFGRFKDLIPKENDFDYLQIPRHALHALAIRLPGINCSGANYFCSSIPTDLSNWIQAQPELELEKISRIVNEKIKSRFQVN
jgi:RluA family pseudouridine synthase